MGNDLIKRFEGAIKTGTRDELLLRKIDPDRLPSHVAVIMDGNGRWAAKRNQPRIAGHRAGAEAVRATVEATARLSIPYLTLYAFSTENWKRPRLEIEALMALLKEFIKKELHHLKDNNIRLNTIGRTEGLEPAIIREVDRAINETRDNTGMLLTVALNYSGRSEILEACRRLIADRAGNDSAGEITEDEFEHCLYTSGLPNPDLLIRTSGEMRVSNFLLWQIAYSEIYVTDTLWPDFRQVDLFEALIEYQTRERRYGDISPSKKGSVVIRLK